MKIEWRMDVEGLLELARQFPDIVREETVKHMQVATTRLKKDVVENTPVGVTENLHGGIHDRTESRGAVVWGIVDTSEPYGEVVEVGRRAGSFPPVAPITLWAQRKFGISEDEAKGAGFLIARKIFHHGTKGAHMFEKAWKQDQAWVMGQLNQITAAVVRRVNGL